ncbi:MAG: hypothetical protein RQ866_00210 [Bacteroidales bacterium]|nr:hypothetical protein [Bacteroidales bacterium]
MQRYIIGLVIITAILTASIIIADQYMLQEIPENWWMLSLFFPVISLISHFLHWLSVTSKKKLYTSFFIMATGMKLLAYLAFLIIVHYASRSGLTIEFLVVFAIFYVIYTIYDLILLLRSMKGNNGKNKNVTDVAA